MPLDLRCVLQPQRNDASRYLSKSLLALLVTASRINTVLLGAKA